MNAGFGGVYLTNRRVLRVVIFVPVCQFTSAAKLTITNNEPPDRDRRGTVLTVRNRDKGCLGETKLLTLSPYQFPLPPPIRGRSPHPAELGAPPPAACGLCVSL